MPSEVRPARTVSVVINTYNRAESLRLTLDGLSALDYQDFEVVVVNGPSTDGTADVLAEYGERIVVGTCANRNLSESRNVGVRLAAGEIVAFIDDDAYPDPGWLDSLVAAYDDAEVAAAGGPVLGHTGWWLQARFSYANAFGRAHVGVEDAQLNPTEFLNLPGGTRFPYTIGTNSSFRRDLLVAVGGFDEEYEYYLDETDVCKRLIDAGYVVRALEEGFVYHKFLASDIRSPQRAIKDRYSVIKNTVYFALRHGLRAGSFADVCRELDRFVAAQRADVQDNVADGLLVAADEARFERDVHRGFDDGLAHYLSGPPRTRAPEWFETPERAIRPYGSSAAPDRLHLCLLSQEYPPGPVHGIGRATVTMAEGLARAGHIVHVITTGDDHPRVDLENGVWVHRIPDQPAKDDPPWGLRVPRWIWDHACTVRDEALRIHARRPLDLVQAPNWDGEGVALVADGKLPVVHALYTPVATVNAMDPNLRDGDELTRRAVDDLAALDEAMCLHATALLATTPAIVAEMESLYGIELDRDRLMTVPLAIEDSVAAAETGVDEVREGFEVLFVGRLEARKGIDVLLAALPGLVARVPQVHVSIVGDDTVPAGPGRPSHRLAFERSAPAEHRARVDFLGKIDDAALQRRYATCDALVVPSRFESFGLTLLEAMSHGKPVVASRVGGMAYIVRDGVTGLLVQPDDPAALTAALVELAGDPDRRREMGSAGRDEFESRYSVAAMAADLERSYRNLLTGLRR